MYIMTAGCQGVVTLVVLVLSLAADQEPAQMEHSLSCPACPSLDSDFGNVEAHTS
jgi:hypothetical protein